MGHVKYHLLAILVTLLVAGSFISSKKFFHEMKAGVELLLKRARERLAALEGEEK